MESQNMYKAEIFDRTQNIKKMVSDMSVHPLVQNQLLDVEDSNIINSWCSLCEQHCCFYILFYIVFHCSHIIYNLYTASKYYIICIQPVLTIHNLHIVYR